MNSILVQIYTNILHMYTFPQTRDIIKIDKISREKNCTILCELFSTLKLK